MEAKAQAATRVLNLLGVAIKASALYFPSHPETVRALDTLTKALVGYSQEHGPLSVRVGKQTLSVDGVEVHLPTNPNLAYSLYSRKLVQFTILPAVSPPELARFVTVVGMERAQLEAAGGVQRLLQESGVWDIEIAELALPADADVVVLGLNAFYGLLGRGRLSPQEREHTVDILRAGPDQVAKLLQNVYALTREVLNDATNEGRIARLVQAVRTLDRIILDEPFDQQPSLHTNLAEATLQLEAPPGPQLAHSLLSGVAGDVSVQVMLDHLSSEQIAKLMFMSLDGGNIDEQVAAVIRGWAIDLPKVKSVLSILEALLARDGRNPVRLTEGWAELLLPSPHRVADEPTGARFETSQLTVSDRELLRYGDEARRIDEAGSSREAIKTLVDLLGTELDEKDLRDVSEALLRNLSWLADHHDFTFLRAILVDLKTLASTPRPQSVAINGLLDRALGGVLLDGLLATLWEVRGTSVERQIQACFDVIPDRLLTPLVRALGTEPRAGMRAMLCDVLVRIGRNHVDELGRFASDNRWYLVRNIASILGRVRAPQGIPHLAPLVAHTDPRVRAQTVEALAGIGSAEAQKLIGTFLNDPEETVRLRALRSLDARGMEAALPSLLGQLAGRDPFNRHFAVRQPVIEAIARLGSHEALPVLRKYARALVVFGRRGRELRRLARLAVDAIESTAVHEPR